VITNVLPSFVWLAVDQQCSAKDCIRCSYENCLPLALALTLSLTRRLSMTVCYS